MKNRMTQGLAVVVPSVLLSLLTPEQTHAQSREELKAQIEAYRAEVFRGAAVFLDASRSEKERVAAVRGHATFYDPRQIEDCVRVARNLRESGGIRAEALGKLFPYLQADTALVGDILSWVRDADTPQPLRKAALDTTRGFANSFLGMVQAREQILSTMRRLTADADPEFREAAFALLCGHGDSYAQKLLAAGLEDPTRALLPPEKSVALLGLSLHGDFYPTLYKVMLSPPNAATRLECIRLLGGYKEAQPTILGYLQGRQEPEDVRLAAAGTLNANAPEKFADYVGPVVADEDSPENVRLYGIQAELLRRGESADSERRRPDEFDRVVRELSVASSSDLVRRSARGYVEKLQLR